MTPDEVTDEMLLRNGFIRKCALTPKKGIYHERDRLAALAQARTLFLKRLSVADTLPAEVKEEVAALYEATHEGPLPAAFWATSGRDVDIEFAISMWQEVARADALAKECAREALNRNISANERRRWRVILATPRWVDFKQIAELVKVRNVMTSETGVEHEIDHIVPLAGVKVCGLHWHGNMQVITAAANRHKLHNFVPGVDGIG